MPFRDICVRFRLYVKVGKVWSCPEATFEDVVGFVLKEPSANLV
jgi:hypothetical protein